MTILATMLSNFGCTNLSIVLKDIAIENRQVMFASQSDSGLILLPGKSQNFTFDFGKKGYPVRQSIRVTGLVKNQGSVGEEGFVGLVNLFNLA